MKLFFLKNKIIFLIFLFGEIFIFPNSVFAASLFFSPSSGLYNVGQNFAVNVLVESSNEAMNAVSGIIYFPPDKLEVASLSKNNSILNLWVQEPSFSNVLGSINFEGIVLNPGFQGSAGKILTINFKAKSAGDVNLSFNSGSILANDGQGTSILKYLGKATFNLKQKEIIEIEQPKEIISINLPLKPEIYSQTHPNQDQWYSNNNVALKWNLPSDIIAMKYSLTKEKNDPNILIDFPFNSKEYKNLDDGVWYFNLQFKNKKGWSEIAHYKIQIDTHPPKSFSIEFIDGKTTRNTRPAILLNVLDETSGIDFYKIKIGQGNFYSLSNDMIVNNTYVLPLQDPGKYTILIQAFDKAGNYSYAKDEFEILPSPSFFEIFTKKISITLTYLIPFIALLIILIILILYGIRYIILLRKKIKKEKEITFKEIHKIFSFLKEETEKKIENLEKVKNLRNLTVEEEKIINDLKKDLDRSEKIIKKDFDEIFKEIDKK